MRTTLAFVSLIAALAVVAVFFRLMWNARLALPVRDRFRMLMLACDVGVVTLADAALGAVDAVDLAAINEFRKSSWLLDNMAFDEAVNPAGGGATLTYGYTRQITQRDAGFRAINSEYTPTEVTRQRFTVDLKPLGGSYQVDRVLANVGPAVANEVAFQMRAVIQAAGAKYEDAAINGDTSVDANGFDGLNKALTGSITEITPATSADVVDFSPGTVLAVGGWVGALKHLDDLLSVMDGPPTALIGNKAVINMIAAMARQANAFTETVLDFTSGGGTAGTVRKYGNLTLVDPGTKAGSNNPVIPVTHKSSGAVVSGSAAGNYTDLYAVRLGLDGFHGITVPNQPLVKQWLPDFTIAGAVKTGEAEMGPVAVALKATRAAAVVRNVLVSTP